ncbi:MAG: aldo/keto reductase [Bacteroidales bacterium]|jgi:predicted aldo/keto reductase-like oxidoreductase|nr:aldo/keto reductase [Bacteroidota bacterium]NLN99176.1 aldo/keto reductase [Bacteroidales bacterium]
MASKNKMDRRHFIRSLGIGSASMMALAVSPVRGFGKERKTVAPANTKMTYRVNHHSKDKVSLLGYGMMRLPRKGGVTDQELVNRQVDYALAHGVNYFDTAASYGDSEEVTGKALSRHPRDSYFIATKLSNNRATSFEESKAMYERSRKRLQVDYIDYYLLHNISGGIQACKTRFIDNGMLDFLLEEKKAGRIRNLGFSYHGDVSAFDYLLGLNRKYQWDFVQIQMNYLDWRHASLQRSDADAEYLYNKCEKLGIQNVVMEPLLGGRLANLPEELASQLKARRPNDSIASWAFRWVGSHQNILVTLSGMTHMEHLIENVQTFSPLEPCTPAENELLASIANAMRGYPTIPCTECRYCMPCRFGVDIPGNFAYYNKAVDAKLLPLPAKDAPDYAEKLKRYQEGYFKALPAESRATQCTNCDACLSKCPQQIRISNQMSRLVELCRQ